MIRTQKIPFIHSRVSWQFALLITLGIATVTIIRYTWLGKQLDMRHLPPVCHLASRHDLRVYAAGDADEEDLCVEVGGVAVGG